MWTDQTRFCLIIHLKERQQNGGRNFFFHLFDLVVVNAHVVHNKTSKRKMSLEIFYEKVAEGLLATASTEIQVEGQSSCQLADW